MELIVNRDYSSITGLRHCTVMDFSGEDFYHKLLNEKFASACSSKEKLVLVLDGTLDGYSPSFIDEAIGNLVYDFTLNLVEENLQVVSNTDARWSKLILEKTFPLWEERRLKGIEPKITVNHPAWYRLVNGKFEKKTWITI